MMGDVASVRPVRPHCALWQHYGVYRRLREQRHSSTRTIDQKIKVMAAPERQQYAGIGASFLSPAGTFHRMWIPKPRTTSQATLRPRTSTRRPMQPVEFTMADPAMVSRFPNVSFWYRRSQRPVQPVEFTMADPATVSLRPSESSVDTGRYPKPPGGWAPAP